MFSKRHHTFSLQNTEDIKTKVLNWLERFNTFCFLDSNCYEAREANYDLLAGAGCKRIFESSAQDALDSFQELLDKDHGWLFGHLGYGLYTRERCSVQVRPDPLGFPDLYFFEPEIVLTLRGSELTIHAENPQEIFREIEHCISRRSEEEDRLQVEIRSRITRDQYLEIIRKLQGHLHRGDCYEINFCVDFFADGVRIDPFTLFRKLTRVSPNPFSGFYRLQDKWLLCASPERFLQKKENRLISQPIKGTLPREQPGGTPDEKEREKLRTSAKDRSENVMVVDLVRNDLSQVCIEGTVKVEELFGIYSFPQVHQMISTVSGELAESIQFSEIINATFPMGSMTGAPKRRVMELIDRYEMAKRGLFSGALGYLDPCGDFDFNVVIRSLMYNSANGYLSFQAGSGITIYSDAEKEWEECLVKAAAIRSILGLSD